MKENEKTILWARVDREIERAVRRLAKLQGVSISEFIRQLIISDLDRRSIFTTKLKSVDDTCHGYNNK